MTGFVGVFIPFGKTMDLIMAIGGCLLFSGYVVYDTYIINEKLSPDEFIMGAISLYLECVYVSPKLFFVLTPSLQLHQPL
jgi:FtsH-binding integral membrane protein